MNYWCSRNPPEKEESGRDLSTPILISISIYRYPVEYFSQILTHAAQSTICYHISEFHPIFVTVLLLSFNFSVQLSDLMHSTPCSSLRLNSIHNSRCYTIFQCVETTKYVALIWQHIQNSGWINWIKECKEVTRCNHLHLLICSQNWFPRPCRDFQGGSFLHVQIGIVRGGSNLLLEFGMLIKITSGHRGVA